MTRPMIVCLCGFTCFKEYFKQAAAAETHRGKIVLTSGLDLDKDLHWLPPLTTEQRENLKARLEEIQREKIRMADEVLFPNIQGSLDEAALCELQYAHTEGKRIRFWDPALTAGVQLQDDVTLPPIHWYCQNCGTYRETTFGVESSAPRHADGDCCVLGQAMHLEARCGICGQSLRHGEVSCPHMHVVSLERSPV